MSNVPSPQTQRLGSFERIIAQTDEVLARSEVRDYLGDLATSLTAVNDTCFLPDAVDDGTVSLPESQRATDNFVIVPLNIGEAWRNVRFGPSMFEPTQSRRDQFLLAGGSTDTIASRAQLVANTYPHGLEMPPVPAGRPGPLRMFAGMLQAITIAEPSGAHYTTRPTVRLESDLMLLKPDVAVAKVVKLYVSGLQREQSNAIEERRMQQEDPQAMALHQIGQMLEQNRAAAGVLKFSEQARSDPTAQDTLNLEAVRFEHAAPELPYRLTRELSAYMISKGLI